MKVFFNGWFGGFMDKTNPGLHYQFFIDLFQKVFEENIEVGNFQNSEILCEFDMLICSKPLIKRKQWKHTFLFSGESNLKQPKNNYDCVLWGERNNNNVVNLPLFVCYLYSNNFVNRLEKNDKTDRVPEKDFCVIISNPRGDVRNNFLEKLEKRFSVDYLGNYKNNKPRLTHQYNTEEFIDKISEYKFIVSMENSREDTYITEKIIHGLLGKTIPMYWGSKRISDYINEERFINYKENENVFDQIIELIENKEKYLEKVNKEVFPDNKMSRNLEQISKDIKNVLFKSKWNHVNQVYTICSPNFEFERFERLNKMFFEEIGLEKQVVKFICPTYKITITDDDMKKHVKEDLVLHLRSKLMKKSEISLFLNFKTCLEDIEKNYKDGIFIIFESDVRTIGNINEINEFFESIYKKKENWDMIHFGKGGEKQIHDILDFCRHKSPYREANKSTKKIIETFNLTRRNFCVEDITSKEENIRLFRKLSTRCLDSLIFTYKGVIKLLNHFKNDTNYGSPMDYYISNFLENNLDYKHYWSDKTYFLQMSNVKEIISTIQND